MAFVNGILTVCHLTEVLIYVWNTNYVILVKRSALSFNLKVTAAVQENKPTNTKTLVKSKSRMGYNNKNNKQLAINQPSMN